MKVKSKYIWDCVSVFSSDASAVQLRMDDLKQNGWKKLRFSPNNRDCDCNADVIEGHRPMTQKELKEREQSIMSFKRRELKELCRLAKLHGYILTKNKDVERA